MSTPESAPPMYTAEGTRVYRGEEIFTECPHHWRAQEICLALNSASELKARASQHEAKLARAADALRVAQEETLQLRKLLWLHHGHEGPALYGDDGEMQCHACVIDFRRADPNDIDERLYAEGVKRYHAEQSALAEVTRERDLYKHSAEVGCINSLDAEQINEGLRTALRRIAERRPKPSERADNGCHPGCECVYCTADAALSVETPAPAPQTEPIDILASLKIAFQEAENKKRAAAVKEIRT